MVRVEAKIEAIVNMLSRTHKYIYESWSGANDALDEISVADFPVCINVLPASGYIHITKTQSVDAPNCMIAFLERSDELDFVGDTNENSINRCKDSVREFIDLCNKSGWFEPITDASYSVIYDRTDAALTGIMLDVRIQEKQGVPICPTSRTFPQLNTL